MNNDISNILAQASGLILQVISAFPRNKKDRTQDQEEALSSLSKAYHTTNAYYAFREDNERDKEKEWNVAESWGRVSILMRKYSENLANRLRLKSRCWQEGDTWSEEAIRDAKIGLDQVWAEVSIHLSKKK